jgi:tripartite-type tricarboxylate transporter receptor subunit TctC
MLTPIRFLCLALSFVLAALVGAGTADAQTWPNRTVRIVVPYAPGGGVSVLAQILGNKLSEIVKQPVVIDNRPGAGGNIGSDAVAKSAPDGYTILLHTSALASAPALYKTLPFDVLKDFTPVTMVIATQLLVGGSPKNPATTLRELIAQAKARPGTLNYASSGPGSSLHLFAELFKTAAGIDLQHIPYRGDAPMITALIAGDVQLAFLPQATGGAAIQGGTIRGLAVTGTKRQTALPNLPTIAEEGVTGLEQGSWNAMWVAAGTSPDIVQAIQQAMAKVLADPQVRERLIAVGQEPVGNSPAEFDAQFKTDVERFAKVVETAKIPKLD